MSGLLHVGIVGCGSIAPTHGAVLGHLETEGIARLVAATDIVPARSAAYAAKFGGEPCPSYEALLARPDIDCVVLCTPSGLHGDMAVQAADAGKHILSEKPLDIRLEKIDRAIAAAQAAGVVYGGIFQERFTPAAQKIKRAIDAGAFGNIVLACAETKWYRSQRYFDSADWRGTWEMDAGVFSNQGIHRLDMIQWFAGEVEEVISATLRTGLERNIESETLGVATVRFRGGAIGTIAMTTLAYDGLPTRVDVCGTIGSAMIVGESLAHFTTQSPFDDEDSMDPTGAGSSGATADPSAISDANHYLNVRDFMCAIRENRPPLVSAREARRAVNLLEMIYRKAEVGPYAEQPSVKSR
jgi:UDP-N-acetyl-2-amino-2-deoxyglucuronate dehydrogenase